MDGRGKIALGISCFTALIILLSSLPFPHDARASEDTFESSQVCKQCHEDIYRNWRISGGCWRGVSVTGLRSGLGREYDCRPWTGCCGPGNIFCMEPVESSSGSLSFWWSYISSASITGFRIGCFALPDGNGAVYPGDYSTNNCHNSIEKKKDGYSLCIGSTI